MKQKADILAHNLQALREERNLSLTALAELSDVSKSTLWQIEAGQSSPTIATLWKIANGLRVPFTAFLKAQDAGARLEAFTDNQPLEADAEGYRLFPLVRFDPERPFEIYYVEIDPGTTLDADPHEGNVEEYVFVVRGTIHITVEDACHVVDSDHFLSFLANCPHRYKNTGEESAAALMMISYLT